MNNDELLAIVGQLGAEEFAKKVAALPAKAKLNAIVAAIRKQRDEETPLPILPLVPANAHACPHCPLTFKWQSQLDKHLRTHASKTKAPAPTLVALPVEPAGPPPAVQAPPKPNELPVVLLVAPYTCRGCGKVYNKYGGFLNHLFEEHTKNGDVIHAYRLVDFEFTLAGLGDGTTKQQKRNIAYLRNCLQTSKAQPVSEQIEGTEDAQNETAEDPEDKRIYQGHDQVARAQALGSKVWNACAKIKQNDMMPVAECSWLYKRGRNWEADLGKLHTVLQVGRVELYWLCRTLAEFVPRLIQIRTEPYPRTRGHSIYLVFGAQWFSMLHHEIQKTIDDLKFEIERQSLNVWWPKYRVDCDKDPKWKPATPATCDEIRAYYADDMATPADRR